MSDLILTLTPSKPTPRYEMALLPLFTLGRTVATAGALHELDTRHGALAGVTVASLLYRHQRGDWGDVDAHDARANRHGLRDGERIVSCYNVPHEPVNLEDVSRPEPSGDTFTLWIITEWDRSATTILLPQEY